MSNTINERQLCKVLKIESLDQIAGSESLQNKVAERIQELSPELIKSLIDAVPELAKTFQATISAMEGIGKSLEDSKQVWWNVSRDLSQSGQMTGDQIIE